MIISHRILLRMRNVSDKSCRENENIHSMFNFFFTENLVIYEIMCKNIVQRDKATFNNAAHAHCMLDT